MSEPSTTPAHEGKSRDFLMDHPDLERATLSPRYGYFVGFMRWGLSLIAAGLAVAVVLWPAINETEVSFTLSHEDVASRDDQIHMVRPQYEGVDTKNRPFVIRAESGLQDSPDDPRIFLEGVSAEFQLDPETTLTATSGSGTFYVEQDRLELGGDVVLTTNEGHRFTAGNVAFDLQSKIATSQDPLMGTGPYGQFQSDSFEVRVDERLAIFKGSVQMNLNPRDHKP